MVRMMFPDFLDDMESYESCRRYWEELVRSVADSVDRTDEWQPWISRYYADGVTPIELAENPITDGRSQKMNRAFKVLQHPPVEEELELVAWLTPYEEEYPDFPEELTLTMSLSEESAELARILLRKWMTPSTAYDEMKTFIRDSGAGG
jgi:hypothetical protein